MSVTKLFRLAGLKGSAVSLTAGIGNHGLAGLHYAFVVNTEWFFLSHRLPIAKRLKAEGARVTLIAPEERGMGDRVRGEGIAFEPLRWRRSVRTISEFCRLVVELFRIYRRIRPDVVHHVTPQPVLFGTAAARLSGVPLIINAVAGRGWFAGRSGLIGRCASTAFNASQRLLLRGDRIGMIFQNDADRDYYQALGLVTPARSLLVNGSGVDLQVFMPAPFPVGDPVVLFASRLLREKGVGEFVEAARLLRARGVSARFVVAGAVDPGNPGAIDECTVRGWQDEGVIEYWGTQDDMSSIFAMTSIVALPSYYGEGVPKVLLEAAAAGRPIVTTLMPGCRIAVEDGVTGILVPPRDSVALASALDSLLADAERRVAMGAAARARAETLFSDDAVAEETVAFVRRLIASK